MAMTFEELVQARRDRRAVSGFRRHAVRPLPAAFVLNMPGSLIAEALPRMSVYVRTIECPACGGSGVEECLLVCLHCHGKGRVPREPSNADRD
jgi:hypothetical protein